MDIYVVVGVYAGVVDHVSAWKDETSAAAQRDGLRREYGIVPDSEAESEHTARVYAVPLL